MKAPITLDRLQEYIIDCNLNEMDTVMLHPEDFDNIVTEFFSENDLMIYRPVEILGTKIAEDLDGEVKRNQVLVLSPLAS